MKSRTSTNYFSNSIGSSTTNHMIFPSSGGWREKKTSVCLKHVHLIAHPHLLVRATSERWVPTPVATNGWLSLAKSILKVALVGRNRSMVTRTTKLSVGELLVYVLGMALYRIQWRVMALKQSSIMWNDGQVLPPRMHGCRPWNQIGFLLTVRETFNPTF